MICPLIPPLEGQYGDGSPWREGAKCIEHECAWWCGGVCVMVKLAVELAKVASRLPKQ
ncbi:hypothetical protein LCGC14_1522540 [marine sediment metagenome]|uniref:Uncharacterized protein n=1 Tax=marine sediment metagenome TaxID=412755 RepID=A0A0F9IYG4_9ZZZZ